jgi:hypothetical protein
MGPRSACVTCYTRLGITIEAEVLFFFLFLFRIRVTRAFFHKHTTTKQLVFEQSGADGKMNLHAKAALGMDAGIGAVVRWDLKALARIAYAYKLYESPKLYLGFPVGPLAVTFSTKMVFSLEARIQLSQALAITTGLTMGFSGKAGMQLDNALLRPIGDLQFDATLPLGPVEAPPPGLVGQLLGGIALKIQTEIGVTLAALLWLKKTGPKLMQVELLIARPQVKLEFLQLPVSCYVVGSVVVVVR